MNRGGMGGRFLWAVVLGSVILAACGDAGSETDATASSSSSTTSSGAGASPACDDGRSCLDLDTIRFCNDGTEVILGCNEICSGPGQYALGCAFDPDEGLDYCWCDTMACEADTQGCVNDSTAIACDDQRRYAFEDCSAVPCTYGSPGCCSDTNACGCVDACDPCLAACEGQPDCCAGCGCACQDACGSSC